MVYKSWPNTNQQSETRIEIAPKYASFKQSVDRTCPNPKDVWHTWPRSIQLLEELRSLKDLEFTFFETEQGNMGKPSKFRDSPNQDDNSNGCPLGCKRFQSATNVFYGKFSCSESSNSQRMPSERKTNWFVASHDCSEKILSRHCVFLPI